jgi:hypothetical protein
MGLLTNKLAYIQKASVQGQPLTLFQMKYV